MTSLSENKARSNKALQSDVPSCARRAAERRRSTSSSAVSLSGVIFDYESCYRQSC